MEFKKHFAELFIIKELIRLGQAELNCCMKEFPMGWRSTRKLIWFVTYDPLPSMCVFPNKLWLWTWKRILKVIFFITVILSLMQFCTNVDFIVHICVVTWASFAYYFIFQLLCRQMWTLVYFSYGLAGWETSSLFSASS